MNPAPGESRWTGYNPPTGAYAERYHRQGVRRDCNRRGFYQASGTGQP